MLPTWLTSVGAKVMAYMALAFGILLSLLKLKSSLEADGAAKLQNQINTETQKVQTQFDQVDNSSLSIDDALDRLSKRTGNGKGS